MINAFMISSIMPRVVILRGVMPIGIKLNVVMLSVVWVNGTTMIVFMMSDIRMNVVMLNGIMMSGIMLMEQSTLKNVNNNLNTNIYTYLEISGGQNSNLYLNVVHSFNTSVS
jgi:hypothetical protein